MTIRLLGLLIVAQCALAQPQRGQGWYGGRLVDFEIREGMAVVEGDIILGVADELMKAPSRERNTAAVNAQSGLWANKTVVYQIDSGLTNPRRVTDAIEHWQSRTSIRFKERSNEGVYVRIQRASGGCASTVGSNGSVSSVILGDECDLGNTIHELGHTIGLFHAQCRADRDRNVRVLYENIDKVNNPQFDQVLVASFDAGPYDYGSIMHYAASAFSNGPRPALVTLPPGIPIGQREGLSHGDIQAAEKLYNSPIDGVTITTNPPGLPVIVDGEAITAPRTFPWKPGETHQLSAVPRQGISDLSRYDFAKWSDGGDQEHTVTIAGDSMLFIASYSRKYLLAAVEPPGAGRVRMFPESEDGYYGEGALVRLKAEPAAELVRFLNWTGQESLADNWQGNGASTTEMVVRSEGLNYVANFVTETVSVTTITSEPVGAEVTIDGRNVRTPFQMAWTPGTTHTIAMADRQSRGSASYMLFRSWSDGGDASHTITAPTVSTTWTAKMTQRFLVATKVIYLATTAATALPTAERNLQILPLSGGTSSDGFYDAETTLEFRATGPAGVPFANWFGDLAGGNDVQRLVVKDQALVGANFLSVPLFDEFGFVNAASLQPGAASADSLMVVYRPNVGPDADLVLAPDSTGRYPVQVNGISVLFNSTPAQMITITRNSILFRVPSEAAAYQSALVTVRGQSGGFQRTMPAASVSPGLYTANRSGTGPALAFNEDGSPNSQEQPAEAGHGVLLIVTGLGAIAPDSIPPMTAEVGGVEAQVAGLTSTDLPGAYGVGIDLSADTPSGEVPVTLCVRGSRTQYNVSILVK
ncbi:MAG: PEGA domain-containing protein [Acidobacteria bacterium]|nr:PEGA domain-containing protein [Acidobacteriota bacterium]